MTNEVDADGVITMYQYDSLGRLEYRVLDRDRDNTIDWAGQDGITRTVIQIATNGSVYVRRTATYVWATNSVNAAALLSVSDVSVDGLRSWDSRFGINGAAGVTNRSDTYYAGGGSRYVTNSAADGSHSVAHYQNGRLESEIGLDAGGGQLWGRSYEYDGHGRQVRSIDARTGITTTTFDNLDRVVAVTSPAPGTGAAAQSTTYSFDSLGRVTKVTLPDGGIIQNDYLDTGELKQTYGSRNYPVQYGYDSRGG